MSWLVVTECISVVDERILGGIDYILKSIGASSPEKLTLLSIQKLSGVTESSSTSPISCRNDVSHIPLSKLQR